MATEDSPTSTDRAVAGAKTLDNGIRVLKAIAGSSDGLTTTEVARAVGVHRTVAYRLLTTLREHSLVTQGADSTFRLGIGVVELSSLLRSDLRSAAQPHMRRLAETTRATVHLTVRDGEDAVGIALVMPTDSDMHVAYRVGRRYPLSVGAAGLAILAGNPPIDGERPEVTSGRSTGYVTSHGEIQSGAWGLAAPLTGGTDPADVSVGVVGFGDFDEAQTARHVLAAAAAIRLAGR